MTSLLHIPIHLKTSTVYIHVKKSIPNYLNKYDFTCVKSHFPIPYLMEGIYSPCRCSYHQDLNMSYIKKNNIDKTTLSIYHSVDYLNPPITYLVEITSTHIIFKGISEDKIISIIQEFYDKLSQNITYRRVVGIF